MNQLKIVKIGNKKYFLDASLKELRNIKNPNDYLKLNELELFLLVSSK
jgi:hypothetical protein